jgi:polyisoprenoid-binding protein YceI
MSWQLDPSHSEILFSVRHMMISKVRGQFRSFTTDIDLDLENPESTRVAVQIDAASIETRDSQRDAHLKSADFLNAEAYPTLEFKSTRVERLGENHGRLHGELTIRGEICPVTLEVEFNGTSRSPWGTTSAGFSATTTINRKDWDLTWNVALETGGWLVSDQIEINIQLELVQITEAQAEATTA